MHEGNRIGGGDAGNLPGSHKSSDQTLALAELRQIPDVQEGVRGWAMGVRYEESGYSGEALRLWQWGWRDAEAGYRAQFKGA